MSKRTRTKADAKLAVVQLYWIRDCEYKQAAGQRQYAHDLALTALDKGETAGPITDDTGMAHWLTHGEKEHVVIDPRAFWRIADLRVPDLLDFLVVDTARVKAEMPKAYAKLLKHFSTKRKAFGCLTWSSKAKAKDKKI